MKYVFFRDFRDRRFSSIKISERDKLSFEVS